MATAAGCQLHTNTCMEKHKFSSKKSVVTAAVRLSNNRQTRPGVLMHFYRKTFRVKTENSPSFKNFIKLLYYLPRLCRIHCTSVTSNNEPQMATTSQAHGRPVFAHFQITASKHLFSSKQVVGFLQEAINRAKYYVYWITIQFLWGFFFFSFLSFF